MVKKIKDYGMIVTVQSAKDSYLFVDGIDRDRYISSILKKADCISAEEITPIVAGLNSDSAKIVFIGGDEEMLRRLMRSVHISYSAYRKTKKCPVVFRKTSYEIVDSLVKIRKVQETMKTTSDFICYLKSEIV